MQFAVAGLTSNEKPHHNVFMLPMLHFSLIVFSFRNYNLEKATIFIDPRLKARGNTVSFDLRKISHF